jgi:hypothetical protein
MSTLEIKRLAKSHLASAKDTIEALTEQGHGIKVTSTANDCVFVTGELGSQSINEAFYLDNEPSIRRLREFNQKLRSYIRIPFTINSKELGAA